ncbi:MAG: B12-binding domain-containing radical SAM protein [Planctomycetes bacterium]|nr:B12-binding domain-containing radical SAM protein [Planctomycetota bacterium]
MVTTSTAITAKKKKILMVYPKFPPSFWSFGFIKDIGGFKTIMPPIGLATIAALTPPEFECKIVDENIEEIDFDEECDIVAMSAMAICEKRLFEVADEFRRRGKLVCMGGPICNVLPERCRPHCDILFEGEGEYTWPKFLNEWLQGTHKNHYVQEEKIDMRDSPGSLVNLFKTKAYRLGCIQTTRGCPFSCEFCDIIVTYGRKVRSKPVENVVKELQVWADAGVDFITIADDNLVGDRVYAKKMLKAVGDWNRARKVPVSFYVEMSVDACRDKELLELMRWANVTEAFLGIETPRASSLKETKKFQNAATPLVDAIRIIQSYGMVTVAGMIVGFDNDDKDIFEDQYRFLQEAGIPIVMLGILQAIPRTPLYERLEKAGRLRSAAQGNNTLSFTNLVPLNISYEDLINGYRELFARIYTWEAVGDRWLSNVRQWGKHRLVPKNPAGREGEHNHVDDPKRQWLQKPMGRPKPHLLAATFKIAKYYLLGGSAKRKFAWRMMWNTFKLAPSALLQTFSYMAYFIHLREYADKVVAKEYKFDYALTDVNTTNNKFGEGGGFNMVKKEKALKEKINVHDAYEGAAVTPDIAETLASAGAASKS